MANMMSKVSQRVQYESSMMSVLVILLGLIAMGIYTIFFTQMTTFMKVMVGINCGAGFMFLSSQLVTTYQQYLSYLEAVGISGLGMSLEEIKNEKGKEL
jgi:hypothetical protein